MGSQSHADRCIRRAIFERRMLSFTYDGQSRLAEPHDYGRLKDLDRVLCYQVSGGSNSGTLPAWRLFEVSRMLDLKLSDQHFPGSRDDDQRHHAWQTIYAHVIK
jgi:hypothetical protein